MENTLEKIEKAWIAIGSLITLVGLTGTLPFLGEIFTPGVASQIVAIVGAFISILQFFRGDEVPVTDQPIIEGDVRSLQAPKQVQYNSTVRHFMVPWSRRKVTA